MAQFGKVVLPTFENFATIELADGSRFQVHKHDLAPAPAPNKGYDLKPDAEVFAVFAPPPPKPEEMVVFLPEGFVPRVRPRAVA